MALGNTVDLVLKATNQASPALTRVAGELGALNKAGHQAASGGLADVGKAIPTIAGSLLSLASAIPGPIGMLAQLGSATVGHLSKMSAEADATLQRMTALADGIQATFEETQAAVSRIRAEAAGNVGQVIEQQYAQELAAIDKAYAKQVAAAKGNALQIAAIEAESAGKRLIAHAQYEAELSKLSQKRLELAKQLGTQLRDAETGVTQALLEEQGKRLQALDVGAARQAEVARAGYQKQLEEIKKLGGTETEQYQLRRQAQEVFEAQSLEQTTQTEIKRRAILKEQGTFLKDLAATAKDAQASLTVAMLESQGKQKEAIEAGAAQRKAILDAEYQQVLERIAKQGLTEKQALEARLSAERAYAAQSQQLAVETADKKTALVKEAAEKEAQALAKAATDKKQAEDKRFADWIENLKAIANAQKLVIDATAGAADATASATATIQESYGKQLEALERTAARSQEVLEERYAAEVNQANQTAMTVSQRRELILKAEQKYAEDSIRLSVETENRRKAIVEQSVSTTLGAFAKLGTGFQDIQSKLTFVTLVQETQKGITAIQQLSTALAAGDASLKAAGLTQADLARLTQGLTQNLQQQAQALQTGTTAVQQNTAAAAENVKVLSDGTKVLSEQAASWATVAGEIGKATGQLTSWAAAEAASKAKTPSSFSFAVPAGTTAQDIANAIGKGGGAAIQPSQKKSTASATSHNQTNNINVSVGSVNDKQRVQELTTTIMQALADAERRRT
jgi:hypothetical protein